MKHRDTNVNQAIIRLADALAEHERMTGIQSLLILKDGNGFKARFDCGKPIPEDIEDEVMLNQSRFKN